MNPNKQEVENFKQQMDISLVPIVPDIVDRKEIIELIVKKAGWS